mmetsp:Transcript_19395/g.39248  ORF Transcript_19395/g.39248 Transcript_19395/m.39248 type:complete len:211 (+) Transcript_19395:742-1374(+)
MEVPIGLLHVHYVSEVKIVISLSIVIVAIIIFLFFFYRRIVRQTRLERLDGRYHRTETGGRYARTRPFPFFFFFFFFFFLLVIGRDFFVPGCDFSVSHGLIGSFVENLLPFYGSPDGFLERILRPLELLDLLPKGNHISLDYFDVSLVRVNLSGEIINRFLKGCDFNRGRFPSNKDTVSQHLKTVLDTPKLALLPLHHCLQHLLLFFQGF